MNSLIKRKENIIYNGIDDYFDNITINDLKPNSWKVPIGGGFYGKEEVKEVIKCYLHGSLSIQKPVMEFERKFSEYIGTDYGVAVNSGTSANILALNSLMDAGYLKKGDEVALPATTFITVATPIIQLGLVPVYIDIDPETLNINIDELRKAILDKKRNIECVMAVHTLGNPVDMTRIMELTEHRGIQVIEDCCEAHGAEWGGKKIGSYGIISTWSFYVAHHMTTGEGGMVLTSDDELDIILRELREFGRDKGYEGERYGMTKAGLHNFDERYTFHRIGWNFRMADAPASFGIQQLNKLENMNEVRLSNAEYLTNRLSEFGEHIHVFPVNTVGYVNTFYSYPIVIKETSDVDRKEFVQFLENKSIETRAIMCGTLSDQPALFDVPKVEFGELKNSRYIKDNAFFIGCHPALGEEELEHIVKTITEYFNEMGLI